MNFFDLSQCPTEQKLDNFTKYVKRQKLARFMVQYELFRKQLNIKGSIIECGVHHGGGVMAWAKLSSILEPYNYHRKIIGFDTFSGFPEVSDIDKTSDSVKEGLFNEDYDTFHELTEAIHLYDSDRYLNHKKKVELIKGDASKTIEEYISQHPYLIISLLYLDFDIYKPTNIALKAFLERMPSGAILAFDELNNPDWPGEVKALLENLNIQTHKLQCFEFEPNISYIQL